jgi:hypothetical protein
MPNVTAAAASHALAGQRHRPARVESFASFAPGGQANVEADRLRDFLVGPLRELARSADARLQLIAEGALEAARLEREPFAYLAQLEDALDEIAASAGDEGDRAIAGDAIAVYRGR